MEIIIILLRTLAIVALLNHVCLVGKAIHFAIMLHASALKTSRLALKEKRYAFKVSARNQVSPSIYKVKLNVIILKLITNNDSSTGLIFVIL